MKYNEDFCYILQTYIYIQRLQLYFHFQMSFSSIFQDKAFSRPFILSISTKKTAQGLCRLLISMASANVSTSSGSRFNSLVRSFTELTEYASCKFCSLKAE